MFFYGIVENRTDDPLKLGRCKVRVFGLHSPDKVELPSEDLPWAIVMQPVNSAATSGIGISPTGLVEGAAVIVVYQDEFKQQPIIIGSIAGVPSTPVVTKVPSGWVSADGTPITSADGSVIESGATAPDTGILPPTPALVVSSACFESIRAEESISSIVKDQNKYLNASAAARLSGSTTLYSYQDTRGLWTIGWGNRYLIDGSEVNENTTLLKSEADALLEQKVNVDFAPVIRKALKAPVTQSMFDAMVSIAYNTGQYGFAKSDVIAAVNSGEYQTAASLIAVHKTNGGKLSARRQREKALFEKNGFPRKDMSGVDATVAEIVTPPDATENPVVTPLETDKPIESQATKGFVDPNNVYPKFFNEPDTSRLIRHENIDQTIVFSKEAARAKGVVSAAGNSWTQPTIPYNSTYPYNHARTTESGHVQEFDDTPGSERIHTYHKSGTYEEIDRNGTKVNRIVGDGYEILERNGNVLIRGTMNVTIVGNNNILVENDSNIDVYGNANMTVGGNMNTGVSGSFSIKCGGEFSVDASQVHLNSGHSASVPIGRGTASGVPEFSELVAPSRHDSDIANYESPDEGDGEEYQRGLVKSGKADEPGYSENLGEAEVASTTSEGEVSVDCSMIPQSGSIDPGFRLSKSFVLRDLDKSGVINVDNVSGLSRANLVCNLKGLAENLLERVKQKYPSMVITSGLRNSIPPGGAAKSEHLTGNAVDIVISGFNREQHYLAIQDLAQSLPAFGQLILEYNGTKTWIHISYGGSKGNQKQMFTMNNHKKVQPFGKYVLIGA
jgi:GH24 family phage-related lysozyme (muramidase)